MTKRINRNQVPTVLSSSSLIDAEEGYVPRGGPSTRARLAEAMAKSWRQLHLGDQVSEVSHITGRPDSCILGKSLNNVTSSQSSERNNLDSSARLSRSSKNTSSTIATQTFSPKTSENNIESYDQRKTSNTNNTARFILTNTGNLTTPQLHNALQYTLRPGLQRLLHLDYKGRLALQTSLEANSLPAQAIQLTSMLPRYRLTRWKAYRDRPPKQEHYIPKTTSPTPKNLLTWNINGLQSKIPMLKELITTHQVGVIAVQEHLRQVHQLPLHIENYVLFEKPKEKGFRGHCVYIHKNIAAHEIDTNCKHIIHLKVFGLTGSKPWNLLAVYAPSGSARSSDRTKLWKQLHSILLSIAKDPHHLCTLMGDFNEDILQITRRIQNRILR
ncbi:hypothetical protein PPACK8108_LOCUS22118 [Phakopsora pachyrhizi]|uniref:Endonuclease/exonuclease/phosphatase domain-containing protein n=1 Tax=Phakopsora pachyrhizi TaxID=170000 RepID=A0AAV0BKY0_PHAPC|nr:hypothetical protein PPACK8108_LOCUS22118 [Phakopsora pachyrhizi]